MRATNYLVALIIVGLPGPASATGHTHPEMPQPQLVSVYGGYNFKDAKARLDDLVDALRLNPTAQGYVMAYAGRLSRLGEAVTRGQWAKEYLVGARGEDASRIVVIDGGHCEEWTVELWVVPSGGVPPYSVPTVDPDEVRIIGSSVRGCRHRLKL